MCCNNTFISAKNGQLTAVRIFLHLKYRLCTEVNNNGLMLSENKK
jgi:hypothetical protein